MTQLSPSVNFTVNIYIYIHIYNIKIRIVPNQLNESLKSHLTTSTLLIGWTLMLGPIVL